MGNITWEILRGKQFMGNIMRLFMWKLIYGKYHVENIIWANNSRESSLFLFFRGQQLARRTSRHQTAFVSE